MSSDPIFATPVEEKSYVRIDEQFVAKSIVDKVSEARIRIAENEEKEIARIRKDMLKTEAEHFKSINKRRKEREEAEWAAQHPEAAKAERLERFEREQQENLLRHKKREQESKLKQQEEDAAVKRQIELAPVMLKQRKENARVVGYVLMGISVGLLYYANL